MKPVLIFFLFLILFWGFVFNAAFGCEWTAEQEKQFQESIEYECKYIKCLGEGDGG